RAHGGASTSCWGPRARQPLSGRHLPSVLGNGWAREKTRSGSCAAISPPSRVQFRVKYSPATAFSCGSVIPQDSCRDCCDADDARLVPEADSALILMTRVEPGLAPPTSLAPAPSPGRAS